MSRASLRRGVALVAALAVLAAFGALLALRASAQALQVGALAAQVRAANAAADADAALLWLRARRADAAASVPLDGAWRTLPDPWTGRWRAAADPLGVRLEVEAMRAGAVARREALVAALAAHGSARFGSTRFALEPRGKEPHPRSSPGALRRGSGGDGGAGANPALETHPVGSRFEGAARLAAPRGPAIRRSGDGMRGAATGSG